MFAAIRLLLWTIALAAPAASAIAGEPGARCEACHAKQVQSFRIGGMARAMGPFVRGRTRQRESVARTVRIARVPLRTQ